MENSCAGPDILDAAKKAGAVALELWYDQRK